MKAVRFTRFGGPEVLEIVDLPDPHPGPGEVRITVRAAGINASDWKKRRGLMDAELPQTLGHEAVGVVDELGEASPMSLSANVSSAYPANRRPSPSWRCCPTTHRSPPRSTSPAPPHCRLRSKQPLAHWISSVSGVAAHCSSTAHREVSAAPRCNWRWCAAPASSGPRARPITNTCVRWAPSPRPTARVWPSGFARSHRAASIWHSMSPAAVYYPTSSPSPAAPTMSSRLPISPAHNNIESATAVAPPGRALHALTEIGELIDSGRFTLPVARTFPLTEVAEAHRVGENGVIRGKLVLAIEPS